MHGIPWGRYLWILTMSNLQLELFGSNCTALDETCYRCESPRYELSEMRGLSISGTIVLYTAYSCTLWQKLTYGIVLKLPVTMISRQLRISLNYHLC